MKKNHSRRQFINSLVTGGIGFGAISTVGVVCSASKSDGSPKNLPVYREVDICVLGGSSTGVFAAIRAARLGAKVAIVERQNAFGGVATNSLVNIWHSLYDTEFKQQIIAGLTVETMDRLAKRNARIIKDDSPSAFFTFNSQELKIELDELVLENGIIPYLHTLFSEPYLDQEGKLVGVIVDNKSGRGLIKAKYFIDATGDGDLCKRLGLETYTRDMLQPPTTCAHFEGWDGKEFNRVLKEHGDEFNIPSGFVWGAPVIGTSSIMLSGTRVFNVNGAIADDLTRGEIEGRRQIRAIMDMMRKYSPETKLGLTALSSYLGLRETRHIKCLYQVNDEDALYGKHFDDAIANGSYVLDLHHQDKPGITFRQLDGVERYSRPGYPEERGRWRPETPTNPTFYQVPLRSIIPPKYANLIVAGRMLDASIIAYSGIRVMVNMNQLGEAAGVTSYLALNGNIPVSQVDYKNVRKTLKNGGSIII
ncbi:membrane protein [Bacteroidia bacterium]|nr:membrane protein [Bacteroidia bacterium]